VKVVPDLPRAATGRDGNTRISTFANNPQPIPGVCLRRVGGIRENRRDNT
jgi:hypothetical protein